MNPELQFSFSNVNDWLKFAEAKNVGLLALNAAAVIGILQSSEQVFGAYLPLRAILIIVFCLSSTICVYSISPVITFSVLVKKMKPAEFNRAKATLNSLFYGNLARLDQGQYEELYLLRNPGSTLTDMDKELMSQILINSEITLKKYIIFKSASWGTFIGFVVSIATVILVVLIK